MHIGNIIKITKKHLATIVKRYLSKNKKSKTKLLSPKTPILRIPGSHNIGTNPGLCTVSTIILPY